MCDISNQNGSSACAHVRRHSKAQCTGTGSTAATNTEPRLQFGKQHIALGVGVSGKLSKMTHHMPAHVGGTHRGAGLRRNILDFWGLGGPRRPEKLFEKMRGEANHLFKRLPGRPGPLRLPTSRCSALICPTPLMPPP